MWDGQSGLPPALASPVTGGSIEGAVGVGQLCDAGKKGSVACSAPLSAFYVMPAHGTHNIPGKLLTYVHAGLPVLARVNPNNDLVSLVEDEAVGLVVPGNSAALLHAHAMRLADDARLRAAMGQAGIALARRMFSPESAARDVAAMLAVNVDS